MAEFFAVGAGAVAKTAIAMMLLKVLDVRWQRMVTWGLVISANLIIWGFAIFLWVIIWQDHLVHICIEGSGIWRFAIFGAGKWDFGRQISYPQGLTFISVVSVDRLRLCYCSLAIYLAPASTDHAKDQPRGGDEFWAHVSIIQDHPLMLLDIQG